MDKKDFYKNGKIYKLICNNTGKIYIGSTCKKLCQRLAQHKSDYKKYLKNTHRYMSSFDIISGDNYDIILIEKVECDSIEELHAKERFHIENNPLCINICKNMGIMKELGKENYIKKKNEEYYINNKEKVDKMNKEYNIKHRDEILLIKKIKYDCECGGKYTYSNKSGHLSSSKHKKFIDNKENTD